MALNFLRVLQPVMNLIPEVQESQYQRVEASMTQKIRWTALTLFIYLVCCQIPIYGIQRSSGSDPFYWMRVILASNRGTLMELGISPIVTSSMIMQFLTGIKFLDINMNVKEDRYIFNGAQKLMALIISITEAFGYVWSGQYGDLDKLGSGNAILIMLQLSLSGIIVILLDDLMQKGYGLGSGISLFIATNICESIVWKTFSPVILMTDSGTEFEGSIINCVHQIVTKPKLAAIYHSFYRTNGPNLNNLVATILISLVVIYFQGFKIEFPIISQKVRGYQTVFPIKLFYTSNIPIIFTTALVSNVYFFSQTLYRRFKDNFFINLLGRWQETDMGGQSIPIGGLAYYLSPPRDITDIYRDPIHCLVYFTFVLTACGLFARYWINFSGEGANDAAKKILDQDMIYKGHQKTAMVVKLKKLIPTAATLGGISIAFLTIIADLMGAIGSGTGILLAVTIIYGYFEMIVKEKQNSEYLM